MPSSKLFYTLATLFVFLLLILYFLHPITNLVGDLGYYLKIGEIIVTTHSVSATNLFSYTNPTFTFINPNWLAEVLFYLVQQSSGFNGLIVLAIVLIVLAFGIVFGYAAKKIDYFTTLIIALPSIHVIYERTEVKPELFSYVFFAIFLWLLYQNKEKTTKWIYALIPLMLLWVNTHIYFFLGFVLIILFLVDALITNKERFASKKVQKLLMVFGGVVAIACVNPQGLQGAVYPFVVLNNYAFPVEENSSFFKALTYYSDTTFPFFGIMIILLGISCISTIKKLQPIDILLACAFTLLGLFAVRTFPLFVIGVFIPFVKSFSIMLQYLYRFIQKDWLSLFKVSVFVTIVLAMIPTITLNLQIHGFGLGVNDNAGQAIDFLKENNIKGPYYNNYDLGNYLIYRLYPTEKVFVDGRPEAYPKAFFEQTYLPMQKSPALFKKISEQYKFNALIIRHTDTSPGNIQHMQQLIKNTDWKMVYLNNTVVVFIKNIPENQQIISKYLITQDTVNLPENDINEKVKVGQLVNFFGNIGWERPWLNANLKYLEYDPNNCSALQNAAYLYQKAKSLDAERYIKKFLLLCNK